MDEKKIYEKPTCTVIILQHQASLLQTSSPNAPGYNDWMG